MAGAIGRGAAAGEEASSPAVLPELQQVLDLVRTNLAGQTTETLNRAAVNGLLRELAPRVSVVEGTSPDSKASPSNLVAAARVYRGKIAYLHPAVVTDGLAGALHREFDQLSASNGLIGLVLDLRCVAGDDYAAAVAVADLFLRQELPLINWGEGLKRSTDKDDAITLPMAVLINGESGGAAEALAGVLRHSGAALLFGNRSSGTAGIARDFPWSDGRVLRIVTSEVQLGDASRIGVEGLNPDVEVPADLERERAWLAALTAPPLEPALSSTNRPSNGSRFRLDEADLVRRWRGEALSPADLSEPVPVPGPEARDPVVLRALDLMDGLAILRQQKSP